MAEKRARPGGIIAPIPTFKAYEAFGYSATTLRSPFERPIEVAFEDARTEGAVPEAWVDGGLADDVSDAGELEQRELGLRVAEGLVEIGAEGGNEHVA